MAASADVADPPLQLLDQQIRPRRPPARTSASMTSAAQPASPSRRVSARSTAGPCSQPSTRTSARSSSCARCRPRRASAVRRRAVSAAWNSGRCRRRRAYRARSGRGGGRQRARDRPTARAVVERRRPAAATTSPPPSSAQRLGHRHRQDVVVEQRHQARRDAADRRSAPARRAPERRGRSRRDSAMLGERVDRVGGAQAPERLDRVEAHVASGSSSASMQRARPRPGAAARRARAPPGCAGRRSGSLQQLDERRR